METEKHVHYEFQDANWVALRAPRPLILRTKSRLRKSLNDTGPSLVISARVGLRVVRGPCFPGAQRRPRSPYAERHGDCARPIRSARPASRPWSGFRPVPVLSGACGFPLISAKLVLATRPQNREDDIVWHRRPSAPAEETDYDRRDEPHAGSCTCAPRACRARYADGWRIGVGHARIGAVVHGVSLRRPRVARSPPRRGPRGEVGEADRGARRQGPVGTLAGARR